MDSVHSRRFCALVEQQVTQLFQKSFFHTSPIGFTFWTTAYPFDVIKSHLQAGTAHPSHGKFHNIATCASYIWKTEGWNGFWKGYRTCIMRSIPANALALLAYEYAKRILVIL
jgi:solute carrier family 25 carnitine/acylcarnitine transporter 20/29